jgi:hypothetical protein
MAWNLGLLGAASFVAPAGAYDLLATEILTGSQASVTFSSLGDYAGTYQHLQIRAVARSDRASANQDTLVMDFNGDSSNSYSSHQLTGDGSAVTSSAQTTRANMYLPAVAAASSATSAFGAMTIDILDPFETSKNTTMRARGSGSFAGSGGGPGTYAVLASGLYFKTDSITSLKLDQLVGSNFVSGSRFSLYGLKASV